MRMYQIIADDLDRRKNSFPRLPRLDPDTLDHLAEKQIKTMIFGTYNKRNKLCKICFELKSVTGSCSCKGS